MKENSLGILSIATNGYIEYWFNLIDSFLEIPTFSENEITFHLFTNSVKEVEFRLLEKPRAVSINLYEIPNYGWPEATLLRYKIYSEKLDLIRENILLHIDADMLIISESDNNVNSLLGEESMFLVSHPGFWRPKGAHAIQFYLTNPRFLIRDLISKIVLGGIGAWENDLKSSAYVRRKLRRKYVAGGIWGGKRSAFQQLCAELDSAVAFDLAKNIISKWHDESHLNRWATQNRFSLKSPSYCFARNYPNLSGIEGVIEAVEKNLQTRI